MGVSFSVNYIHDRWLFRAGILDTDAPVRKDLPYGTAPWPAGGTLDLQAVMLSVGWRVVNAPRWRIAPMVGYANTRSTYQHPEGVALDPAETPAFAQAMIELDVEYKLNRLAPAPDVDGTWSMELAARRRDSCIA